jgi:hypothetical protein
MTQTQFAANNSHLNILLNSNHPITLLTVLRSYPTDFQIASFSIFNAITLAILQYCITTNMTTNLSLNFHLILSHLDTYNLDRPNTKFNNNRIFSSLTF